MQTAAFLIFRFFDMVKPPPIRYFDQKWKGGFGVMADDIIAAFSHCSPSRSGKCCKTSGVALVQQ
jgi:phosphatidylglycerophosphatase A